MENMCSFNCNDFTKKTIIKTDFGTATIYVKNFNKRLKEEYNSLYAKLLLKK